MVNEARGDARPTVGRVGWQARVLRTRTVRAPVKGEGGMKNAGDDERADAVIGAPGLVG